ncbi:MAG: PAS domain-containing sensor histidine kinase [Nocardioides sp.]
MSRVDAVQSRTTGVASVVRSYLPVILLVPFFASSLALLLTVEAESRVPAAWPAAGLLTGLLLLVDTRLRGGAIALAGVLLVLAHLVAGYDAVTALGFGLGSVAGSWVTLRRLQRGLQRRRVGLVEEGDVFRLIAAATQGAVVAAVVSGVTVALSGEGSPWLAMIAVWGTHAAAQLMLVPLFLDGLPFAPLATVRERVVQSLLIVGVTALIFSYAAVPPLVFAIMPMFAWLAFRGTLREATLLLTGVGVVATLTTSLGLGPVHELTVRYSLAPELMIGFLQLFLIDCALILLPLSVMTTQQRMSAARATSGQQTLQRLVDAATGSAIIAVDLDGRVEVFNPGAEAVMGLTAAETTGIEADRLFSYGELLRQGARLQTRPVFSEICAATVAADGERHHWSFHRPGGEQRTMLMAITPVSDERGAVAGYLCVAEDVTEREEMHRSLLTALAREREAVDGLRELERVKTDFVATVSHELRTPLTSMIGYVELLEDGEIGELSDLQQSVAVRVRRNGRRLLLLVEDLLLLSKIESRQMSIAPVPCDLRTTARAAYEALGPMLETRDLEVVVRLPDQPVSHVADPEQVERMLVNLLGNAVKFTPDGGRVELVVADRHDSVEIVVLDSGMGIPVEEQGQLFARFFRASTATAHAVQGTGLGLTIVRAIVDLHRGEIAVSSSEGIGTTVSVSLPKELARVLEIPRAVDPAPTG